MHKKNLIKFILIVSIILFTLFPLGMFFYPTFFGDEIEYSINKDAWDIFGNGRFQVGNVLTDVKILQDKEISYGNIFGDIDKYIEKDPYVYLVSYHSESMIALDGPFHRYKLGTGEYIRYENLEEVPQYLVLNYRTGEGEFYIDFENIPEEDQEIFNKKVWFWCEIPFWRTCYERD